MTGAGAPAGRRDSLGEKLRRELVEYLGMAAYLYVCFGALLLFEAALLQSHGAGGVHHGTAAVKALILGKFLVVGEALGVGGRSPARSLAWAIARRTLLLGLLLVVLTVIEELVVGHVHGRSPAATVEEMAGGSAALFAAKVLLLMLVLVPLVAFGEVRRALGADGWQRLWRREGPPRAGAP